MTIEEIKALFPLKGQLTQEILNSSNVSNIYNCNGAKTLQQVIPDKTLVIHWGIWTGFIEFENEALQVRTIEDLDFMDATEPQEVTFILI